MPPKPPAQTRAAAQQRIAKAAELRDKTIADAVAKAETAFWAEVAAELRDQQLLQTDVAQTLGITRETVRTRLKKYAA